MLSHFQTDSDKRNIHILSPHHGCKTREQRWSPGFTPVLGGPQNAEVSLVETFPHVLFLLLFSVYGEATDTLILVTGLTALWSITLYMYFSSNCVHWRKTEKQMETNRILTLKMNNLPACVLTVRNNIDGLEILDNQMQSENRSSKPVAGHSSSLWFCSYHRR